MDIHSHLWANFLAPKLYSKLFSGKVAIQYIKQAGPIFIYPSNYKKCDAKCYQRVKPTNNIK